MTVSRMLIAAFGALLCGVLVENARATAPCSADGHYASACGPSIVAPLAQYRQ